MLLYMSNKYHVHKMRESVRIFELETGSCKELTEEDDKTIFLQDLFTLAGKVKDDDDYEAKADRLCADWVKIHK